MLTPSQFLTGLDSKVVSYPILINEPLLRTWFEDLAFFECCAVASFVFSNPTEQHGFGDLVFPHPLFLSQLWSLRSALEAQPSALAHYGFSSLDQAKFRSVLLTASLIEPGFALYLAETHASTHRFIKGPCLSGKLNTIVGYQYARLVGFLAIIKTNYGQGDISLQMAYSGGARSHGVRRAVKEWVDLNALYILQCMEHEGGELLQSSKIAASFAIEVYRKFPVCHTTAYFAQHLISCPTIRAASIHDFSIFAYHSYKPDLPYHHYLKVHGFSFPATDWDQDHLVLLENEYNLVPKSSVLSDINSFTFLKYADKQTGAWFMKPAFEANLGLALMADSYGEEDRYLNYYPDPFVRKGTYGKINAKHLKNAFFFHLYGEMLPFIERFNDMVAEAWSVRSYATKSVHDELIKLADIRAVYTDLVSRAIRADDNEDHATTYILGKEMFSYRPLLNKFSPDLKEFIIRAKAEDCCSSDFDLLALHIVGLAHANEDSDYIQHQIAYAYYKAFDELEEYDLASFFDYKKDDSLGSAVKKSLSPVTVADTFYAVTEHILGSKPVVGPPVLTHVDFARENVSVVMVDLDGAAPLPTHEGVGNVSDFTTDPLFLPLLAETSMAYLDKVVAETELLETFIDSTFTPLIYTKTLTPRPTKPAQAKIDEILTHMDPPDFTSVLEFSAGTMSMLNRIVATNKRVRHVTASLFATEMANWRSLELINQTLNYVTIDLLISYLDFDTPGSHYALSALPIKPHSFFIWDVSLEHSSNSRERNIRRAHHQAKFRDPPQMPDCLTLRQRIRLADRRLALFMRLVPRFLLVGGSAICKLQGNVTETSVFLLKVLNTMFDVVKIVKLRSSRDTGLELYVLCTNYLGTQYFCHLPNGPTLGAQLKDTLVSAYTYRYNVLESLLKDKRFNSCRKKA